MNLPQLLKKNGHGHASDGNDGNVPAGPVGGRLYTEPHRRQTKMLACASIAIVKNVRREIPDYLIRGLAESLLQNGLIEPIVVRPLAGPGPKGERYELVAGERRLRAAMAIGWAEIESAIDPMPDDRARLVRWTENYERVDPTVYDEMIEIQSRRKEMDETAGETSERLHIKKQIVEDYNRIADLVAPDLIEKLRLDARSEIVRRLTLVSRVDGPTQKERHARQRKWWATEGWIPRRQKAPTEPGQRPQSSGRASRPAILAAADDVAARASIRSADGNGWETLSKEHAAAVAEALRWAAEPAAHKKPV